MYECGLFCGILNTHSSSQKSILGCEQQGERERLETQQLDAGSHRRRQAISLSIQFRLPIDFHKQTDWECLAVHISWPLIRFFLYLNLNLRLVLQR